MEDIFYFSQKHEEFEKLISSQTVLNLYVAITKESGPSVQLLDFFTQNEPFDGFCGLEGFHDLSIEAKHEILLSTIQSDGYQNMALESMTERLSKMTDWLMTGATVSAGGAILLALSGTSSKVKLGALILGGISLASILAGGIVSDYNRALHGVISPSDFGSFQHVFNDFIREELLTANRIPNSPESPNWDTFIKDKLKSRTTEAVVSLIENLFEKRISEDSKLDKVKYHRTTRSLSKRKIWTEAQFTSATKWTVEAAKKVRSLEVDYAEKLHAMDKWILSEAAAKDSSAKIKLDVLSKALNEQLKSFHHARHFVKWAETELDRVGHLFQEK